MLVCSVIVYPAHLPASSCGEERSVFCIDGVREGNWTWEDLLTFNEDLNLCFVSILFSFSLVATTTYADQVDI